MRIIFIFRFVICLTAAEKLVANNNGSIHGPSRHTLCLIVKLTFWDHVANPNNNYFTLSIARKYKNRLLINKSKTDLPLWHCFLLRCHLLKANFVNV
ncbi:hypothetical protein GDO81_001472 [Engystomops pustulosus]|uniref:Secreted protein n=1 Tax=Engystomops pustulosus TaxID=76066 RepID=A0AAV7DET0_ENGPU|nr:hypothetical protein GDO81_001472 [Engystomops pustulosus]